MLLDHIQYFTALFKLCVVGSECFYDFRFLNLIILMRTTNALTFCIYCLVLVRRCLWSSLVLVGLDPIIGGPHPRIQCIECVIGS